MKLKFLGVRGSRPVHKSELLGYGGNTTSMEFIFEKEKFHLFLDGGSGLAHDSYKEAKPLRGNKIYFLITHTHWDHILGLSFCKLFLSPKNKFTFFASSTSKAKFSDLFLGLHSSVHLPVPPYLKHANIDFVPIHSGTEFMIENVVKVKAHQINHQGITLAYRLEYKKSSVAIVTDIAPIEKGNHLGEGMQQDSQDDKKFEEEYRTSLVNFLKGTHTVVFDTHFTEENIKPDWGHSTPKMALKFCEQAKVKRLILFHHAPEDDDKAVDKKLADVRAETTRDIIDIEAAREGDIWNLYE